jgi:hypothetical protein
MFTCSGGIAARRYGSIRIRVYNSTGFGRPELRKIEVLIHEHADQLRKAWDDYFTN